MAQITTKEGKITIRTARLTLRAAHESDLKDFHVFFSDEEVMRYWSEPPFASEAKTKHYLDHMIASPTNGILDFALVLRSSNTTIGKLGIFRKDTHSPEVGFMLAHFHWRQGLIAEAMKAWLEWVWSDDCASLIRGQRSALEESEERSEDAGGGERKKGGIEAYEGRRVERMIADVDPRNEGSLGVLRKFGFETTGTAEKTFETHLGWCDSIYLELRRPEI